MVEPSVTVIIAEDEVILRESLIDKLKKFWPEINILAAVDNGEDALQAINVNRPDVVFLDIQMGEISGIDVVKNMDWPSDVVFITAYSEYAVNAFEQGAHDYLLKPFSDSRLVFCIDRLKQRRALGEYRVPNSQQNAEGYITRITLQIGLKIWIVPIEDVLYFQANGRYIKVVTQAREALIRMTLKQLITQLNPDDFWQIHRSTVVNVHQTDYVNQIEGERLQLFVKSCSTPLLVSKNYHYLFKQR
ncbi:LytR/AlgR family response regulator transcription factor [Colwelliaceae bacterium 6441]